MFTVALSATEETGSQHPPVGEWANKINVDLQVSAVKRDALNSYMAICIDSKT